jgi:hypothetical protein
MSPRRSQKPLEFVEFRVQLCPTQLFGAQELHRVSLAHPQAVFDAGLLREQPLYQLLTSLGARAL